MLVSVGWLPLCAFVRDLAISRDYLTFERSVSARSVARTLASPALAIDLQIKRRRIIIRDNDGLRAQSKGRVKKKASR